MTPRLTLSPRRVIRFLALLLVPILIGHVLGLISTHVYGHGRLMGLVPLFSLDSEANIPTLYGAGLLLFCALLLGLIARAKRQEGDRWTRYWAVLAAIFAFMAVDEAASVHEILIGLRELYATSGVLHFPWVAVYLPLALLLGVVYLRFLGALPRAAARGFVLAGVVYVGGAAGVEMVGGAWAGTHGEQNLTYSLITTMEELAEIGGLLLFVHTLLSYMLASGAGREVSVAVVADRVAAPAASRERVLGTAPLRPGLGLAHDARATGEGER